MSDKKSMGESIEDKIKRLAKEAEDLADKVSADEEPVVLDNTPPEKAPVKGVPN